MKATESNAHLENLGNSMEDSTPYDQIKLLIKLSTSSQSAISELYEILQEQHKRLDKLQQDSDYISQINAEIFNMVNEQQQSNPIKALEAVTQKVSALEQGVMKIYYYLKEDNIGKELKSNQQILQKAIETSKQKTTMNVGYLDWQQIATIITATAVISSLCSLVVFQLASNMKTDQPFAPVEKLLKPKPKKITR